MLFCIVTCSLEKAFTLMSLDSLISLAQWVRQLVVSLLSIIRRTGPMQVTHVRSLNLMTKYFPLCLPFHDFWFSSSEKTSYHFMHSKLLLNFLYISKLDHYPFPRMEGNSHKAVKGSQSLLSLEALGKLSNLS